MIRVLSLSADAVDVGMHWHVDDIHYDKSDHPCRIPDPLPHVPDRWDIDTAPQVVPVPCFPCCPSYRTMDGGIWTDRGPGHVE